MDDAVYLCEQLSGRDVEQLKKIELGMPIVADISRADLLMFCQPRADEAIVIVHARPRSVTPVYSKLQAGRRVRVVDRPAIIRAFEGRRVTRDDVVQIPEGAPVVQETHPVVGENRRVIGALCIETNSIEMERHLRRKKPIRVAVGQLQRMLLTGQLEASEHLSPFGEHDGILVVDSQKRITYISGVGTNLYLSLIHI